MSLLDRTFIITDDRYDVGCGLQEYNGVYSLVEAKEGEKKIFLKWVYPQKYDQDTKENFPGDKAFPKSVAIAEGKEATIAALEGWLAELKGEAAPAETKAPGPDKDDIPF